MILNGILNVHKEAGYTSHDVVARLRGILRQKKIGHTGTLDPDATGVLPVCLGKATKVCSFLEQDDKTYQAGLLLGISTDTEDISGRILNSLPVEVTEEEIREIVLGFCGEYSQVPPMYSAKKVGGKKLYELARQGITVERKPSLVTVKDITIQEVRLPRVSFTVTCSKGTYIRSLCRDIGEKAGCGACMESLLRTRVGRFPLNQAHTLSEIESLRDQGRLDKIILPIDRVFGDYPRGIACQEAEKLLYNGNPLPRRLCHFPDEDPAAGGKKDDKKIPCRVRIYDQAGAFIGIYSSDLREEDYLKPVKIFYTP